MKKLNNKGFAISTILYSLLIMVFLIVILLMGIMSSNRINTKNLVSTIEEELNRYSLTGTEFSPTDIQGEAQEYIVPYGKAGWYRIELWGAAGGDSSARGGAGAYTSGVIYLEENTILYFYIGTEGNGTTGGANGGGNANGAGRGGGGATDVRLSAGNWNDNASLNSRIMVAAGGAGAQGNIAGENGGTLEAGISTNAAYGKGATQTAGGAGGTSAGAGKFGIGGNGVSNGSGGGGGYYGGGGGGSNSPGGGGSSYIQGYAGAGVPGRTHTIYFIDGMMSENANSSSGRAKIELISMNDKNTPPTKKSAKLNNVRYIKDCITSIGASGTTPPQWLEIQAIQNGRNIAYGKTGTPLTDGTRDIAVGGNSGSTCSIVDLGGTYNLDELAVWHIPTIIADASAANSRVLNGHALSVSSDNSTWVNIITPSTNGETVVTSPEGSTGTHILAWDPDYNAPLPDGTYYIFSSLYPNTSLITAQNSLVEDTDGDGLITPDDKIKRVVGLSPINGSELQKWVFTRNGSYYKIVERESNQAMQIVDNNGHNGSNVNTSSAYNELYRWADWEVIPLGDGTYRIKPKVQPSTNPDEQTYLATNSNNWGVKNSSIILSTYQGGSFAQRFYLVSAE